MALHHLRRQSWARPGVRELYSIADVIRQPGQLVERARKLASAAGDHPQTWEILTKAARVEVETWSLEAQLDAARAGGFVS